MLSPDGKLLAVATISSVKVFSVRRRKGDERGVLRVQKLEVPSGLADGGARLVSISPDSRWLCVVRPNSDVYLARIVSASSQEKPQILPDLCKVNRAPRHHRYEKASHGTLGNFERTIRTVAFSEDSRLLAAGDLSGCVDVWVLEDVAESSPKNAVTRKNKAEDSDDESSDDEDEQPVIEGQRWQPISSDSVIPRLKSGIILLSFRPQSRSKPKLLTNGVDSASHGSPASEDRLIILTSEHQLVEFEALKGKLSDWSRRNPKAYLPAEFTGVKDRAMGGVWDVYDGRERLWLYGTSWLWMFDLQQDFPAPDSEDAQDEAKSSGQLVKASSSHKRKRELEDEDTDERRKANSGAGDRIPRSQAEVFLGTKMRKIEGTDESQGEWIPLEKARQRGADDEEEDYEHDATFTAANESNLARLRRNPEAQGDNEAPKSETPKRLTNGTTEDPSSPASGNKKSFALVEGSINGDTPIRKTAADLDNEEHPQPPRRWWHTYKYRDILGIVPLSHPSGEEAEEEEGEEEEEEGNRSSSQGLEVAVVERPMWDVPLPGRYVRDYE